MKPDWDKLVSEYKDSTTIGVYDVDCTAGGKSLCDSVGVRGYPTIKHGAPDDLQDYSGGRSYDDLKKFAEGLGPQCGPANIDLCDSAMKAKIEVYQRFQPDTREKMIEDKEAAIAKLQKNFKEVTEGLQKEYKEASAAKEKQMEAIKAGGLGLLKAVQAFETKKKTDL